MLSASDLDDLRRVLGHMHDRAVAARKPARIPGRVRTRWEVVNAVCTARLNAPVSLVHVMRAYGQECGASHIASRFPTCYTRMFFPELRRSITVSIFESGEVRTMGTTCWEQAALAMQVTLENMRKRARMHDIGLVPGSFGVKNTVIHAMLYAADGGVLTLDVDAVRSWATKKRQPSSNFTGVTTHIAPEAMLDMGGGQATVVLFRNGGVIIVGSYDRLFADRIVDHVLRMCLPFIDVTPLLPPSSPPRKRRRKQ